MHEESACTPAFTIPNLAPMGRPFTYRIIGMQCVLVSFCLVITHVEAIGVPHMDTRSYSHWASAARNGRPLDKKAPSLTKFRPKVQLHDPAAVARNGQGDDHADHNTEKKEGRQLHPITTRLQKTMFRRAEMENASENGGSVARSEALLSEVKALTSFRTGILGGDVMAAFQSWGANDSTPCNWLGVSCSTLGSPAEQHVTAIQLPSFQLTGSINSALLALSKLPFLETVDLSNNKFSSNISGPAIVNFLSLAFLNLSYNHIRGEIPDQIGDLSNLQSLVLQYNEVSGKIPLSICNCTSLRVLNLEANFLQGQIPPSIGRLYHLEVLNLASYESSDTTPSVGNQISGSLPPSLGNCSSLRVLKLDFISLQGQIPQELSLLQSLQIFSLPGCSIQGVIPRWIGNLSTLVEVRLSYNQFQGPIPAELGKLRHLSWLDLGYNSLSGDIPSQIGNCTSLTALIASVNYLTGIIPSGLENCKLLQVLHLRENPLMDPEPIPAWLGSLTELSDVDLANMNLLGEIPNELGGLSNLASLSIDRNAISGSISPSLLNCTSLQILACEYNNLTGLIPPEFGLLVNLSYISVAHNLLTGSIPVSITNMTQLSILDLSFNFLSGTIGGQWGLLPLLTVFSVNDNSFLGSIPSTLGNCSNLFFISLGGNHLTGEIPAMFGNISQLTWLSVSSNELSGKIPSDLARCSLLTVMDLSRNKLEGPFLSGFGGLTDMMYLDVSHNELTGMISHAFSSLGENKMITWLDISSNRFTGSVQGVSISQMVQLTYMNISYNLLSGPLSSDWSSLNSIQVIDISANTFSGYIPNLDKLIFLQWLDISLNNFSGEIPKSLASLPDLGFFNASYNNFAGPVPTFSALASNVSAASFLGNPGLCGGILGPSRACGNRGGNNSSHSSGKCKGFQCPNKWIPVLVAGAIVFIV